MDTCQPIYITVRNNKDEKYFLLIIEDEKLKNAGDIEPYHYAFSWGVPPLKYFRTPVDAYKHAMELFPRDRVIEKITSMSMNEFILEKQLRLNYF